MTTQPAISSRKADHIDLCTDGDVAFRAKTTLSDAIELVHNALPEMAVSDVDLTANFAGKTLRAPIVMAAMTGGVDRADAINRDLATVAQEFGIGFAFGPQRPFSPMASRRAIASAMWHPTRWCSGTLASCRHGQRAARRWPKCCAFRAPMPCAFT